MATTTLKKAASKLAKDVAAANALRSTWKRSSRAHTSGDKVTASASSSDEDDDARTAIKTDCQACGFTTARGWLVEEPCPRCGSVESDYVGEPRHDAEPVTEAEPADAPSALVNSAWLGDLVTMLRTRANELEEMVTHHRACLTEIVDPERRERERDAAHETMQAYTILARELRVAAVRAERQAEDEQAGMRDAVNRMHLATAARPGFALVG